MFRPALVRALRGYTLRQATTDALSGVIVAVVALPLAIAFALASGLPPEVGLYTAIVGGLLISALGGSDVQIGGPTGAFVVIVYGIVQTHGLTGLTVSTLMAGAVLLVLGLARLGSVIKFIPYPVTTGFTAGIAVVIFTGQVRDALGLDMPAPPAGFLPQWAAYLRHARTLDPSALFVTGVTVLIVLLWPRVSRRLPGMFVALIATTALVKVAHLPVETVGSRFGSLPSGLPRFVLPTIDVARMPELVGPALAIALLGAVEALLSAVVADGMTGRRHDSNTELVAQGLANLAVPFFGGMPATGAIARTATNVRNGGRTPVAGIVHALVLLLIVLLLGRWVELIPLPTLAAILIVVAYHMSDWRAVRAELRAPRSDLAVLITTLALTVLVDLAVAIQVGMVLAAFLFMRRMAEVSGVSSLSRLEADGGHDLPRVPSGTQIYEIRGSFFFGAAEKFKDTLAHISNPPDLLVIGMREVLAMDSTGLRALREVVRRSRAEGSTVRLAGVHAQPLLAMERSGFLDEVGREILAGTVEEAIADATGGDVPYSPT